MTSAEQGDRPLLENRSVVDIADQQENGSNVVSNASKVYGAVVDAVVHPVEDFKEVTQEALSIKDFWRDMVKRERTEYHQATLCFGFVQFLLVVCYFIVCEADHESGIDRLFLHYVAIEVGIGGIAQLIYSTRGICLENSSMLLTSAINGIFLSVRLGMSIHLEMLPRAADEVFFGLFLAATLGQLFCAFRAWGGEFSRFITFRISADPNVQFMYRKYELLMAGCLMDLQASSMAIATVMFFTTVVWWHYLVFGLLLVLTIVQRSSIRQAVRLESKVHLWLVLPLYVLLPFMIGFAMYHNEFVEVNVTPSCRAIAHFTAALFFLCRLILGVILYWNTRNFGMGMKQVYQNQKTSRDFFRDEKSKFRPMFLAPDESPIRESTHQFNPTRSDFESTKNIEIASEN